MLERGYGVNINLAKSLGIMGLEKLPEINRKLGETFYRKISMVQSSIFMPQEHIYNYNSSYIIEELCKKLNYSIEDNIPYVPS